MSLVNTLKDGGISVQLKHDDKETTWEEHGWIKVTDDKGAVLLEHSDIQHNRNYGDGLGEKLGKELLEKVGKEEEKPKEKEGGIIDKVVAACSPKGQVDDTDDKAADAAEGEGEKVKEEEKVDEKAEEQREEQVAAA